MKCMRSVARTKFDVGMLWLGGGEMQTILVDHERLQLALLDVLQLVIEETEI